MFIPPLQHELVEDLWDYEQNFMSMQELLSWAERGFKAYLMEMPEERLKARHKRLQSLVEHYSDIVEVNDAL